MRWSLSDKVDLHSTRIAASDADRQMRTAEAICERLNDQFGLVLADEVGMGKTFVALAVAVSVAEATGRRRPIVVMVPSAVKQKWPKEWAVFRELCLAPGSTLRATETTVTRGSEFLKLLDDDSRRRKHMIFLTHGALTNSLRDPFVKLAIVRQAMLHQRSLAAHRKALPRWASRLFAYNAFHPERVQRLIDTPTENWRDVWERMTGIELDDDPVPFVLGSALRKADLSDLRQAIGLVPLRSSAGEQRRLSVARTAIRDALDASWRDALHLLQVKLPLLILDEAHHLKNPTQLAHLFASKEAEQDAEALRGGPLGDVFERMLFLTATPFQLGHRELLNVLGRFEGVRASRSQRDEFHQNLSTLGTALDATQAAALRLERRWGRLETDDLAGAAEQWWDSSGDDPESLKPVIESLHETRQRMSDAEQMLRPWVVRHGRPLTDARRTYVTGAATDPTLEAPDGGGINIAGASVLPFLLAARAQALTSLNGQRSHEATRAYFAEGLASSFEAYADTRRNQIAAHDDTLMETSAAIPPDLSWYLDRIQAALPADQADTWGHHPKIAATTRRVVDLWRRGEKSLVFCFYRATGRALRSHISRALTEEVGRLGNLALGGSQGTEDIIAELESRADRLLRKDARGSRLVDERVRALAAEDALDDETLEMLVEVVTRFMRTPSFLVRFVDLSASNEVEAIGQAFDKIDDSSLSLATKLSTFSGYLGQLIAEERSALSDALLGIQTGTISTVTSEHFDDGERSSRREATLPNVRLANGEVRSETRHRLMQTFNTPFFPEVLVASSVMAEGVDLHLDCRHVIHHDLDWNPSVLEQRTGRVDRINSKAERSGQPVVVYEPFLGGTQDEKQFKVVKDRERWFNVVMGQTLNLSEAATDRIAQRVPLPEELAEQLRFHLGT